MEGHQGSHGERRRFYVSVQAGQILEDRGAAAYELEIDATREEANKLRELMEELSTMEEAAMFHFSRHYLETYEDKELNGASDELLIQIYKLLYDCGTEETRRHIESMQVLE